MPKRSPSDVGAIELGSNIVNSSNSIRAIAFVFEIKCLNPLMPPAMR